MLVTNLIHKDTTFFIKSQVFNKLFSKKMKIFFFLQKSRKKLDFVFRMLYLCKKLIK